MNQVSFFRNVCVVFFMFLVVWKADGQARQSPAVKKANIIVLLDVSDRLKKDGQIQRDIKIIRYIVAHFQETFVKRHLDRGRRAGPYRHRLTFAVPEQPVPVPKPSVSEPPVSEEPKPYKVPSAILSKLKIRDSGRGIGFPEFQIKRNILLKEIESLYEFVQEENPYTGADIWKWFRDDAEQYLAKDFHNYIICLSDGYLKFNDCIEANLSPGRFIEVGKWREKSNWREYITDLLLTKKDFSGYDITFRMIEINLHRDPETGTTFPYDLEIMLAHWKPWLESMGIKDYDFKLQVPEEVLGDVISSFLEPREKSTSVTTTKPDAK